MLSLCPFQLNMGFDLWVIAFCFLHFHINEIINRVVDGDVKGYIAINQWPPCVRAVLPMLTTCRHKSPL